MPAENKDEKGLDEVAIEKTDRILDGLFGTERESEEEDDQQHQEDQREGDREDEEESSEDQSSEDEENGDDEEVDWESDDSAQDEEEEEDPKTESAARKQAKLKGREAKELKAKLTERELELERLKVERDEFAARVQEIEATKLRPEDHEEYRELRESVLSDVTEASDLLPLPDPTLVPREFGNFMADYLAMTALQGEERSEARTKLKGLIVDRLKLSEIPYAEMDDDERRQYEGTVTDVLKIVQRNVSKTKELQKLHSTLSERAKNGQLAVGVRSYENTVREFKPILDAVGDLADDVIEANPYAIESVVAKIVKTNPKAKARLEKAKADVLEVIVGPRALTQAEIDKLEANGTDLKTFMAERQKAHRAKQQKLAALFVQGLMTRSLTKEMAAKLAKYEDDKESEESEFDAIRRSTSKKKAEVKEKVVRPKDRQSPLVTLLGFDADD